MCKETPNGEKCQTTYLKKKMCQFRFSLFVYVSCDLFVFVLFCRAFSKAVFDSNFGLSGFVFLSLWRFVSLLRACCSIMWFSPFSCFLWLLSLLVAFFKFLSGEFLLHVPCWLHFYLGSFSYTSRAGFIFIWGVSLTHPVLASFLSGEFLLHISCWL